MGGGRRWGSRVGRWEGGGGSSRGQQEESGHDTLWDVLRVWYNCLPCRRASAMWHWPYCVSVCVCVCGMF